MRRNEVQFKVLAMEV